jgi:pSer/pThr/pTyr-binding forkhead associated (FHA) protein
LDDDNVFRLIDKNSSSGTRLNGRQIKPEVAIDLAEGDEIVLGNLAQRGVKLRFNYMSGEGDIPLSGSADDRTHLLSDKDAQKWDDLMDNSS